MKKGEKDRRRRERERLTVVEYVSTGLLVYQCTTNNFCYGSASCCTAADAKQYFVDPNSGEVSDSTSSSNVEPTWWGVDSVAVLRATSSLSEVPTLASTITSAASPTDAAPTNSASGVEEMCPERGRVWA